MSGRPKFDATALVSAWGPSKAPATFDRAGRVKLLGEFAEAALSGREPSRESLIFLAGAISAWLSRGGSLERDFLKVTKPKSHHTPAAIWQEIHAHQDERQDTESGDSIAPSSSESE